MNLKIKSSEQKSDPKTKRAVAARETRETFSFPLASAHPMGAAYTKHVRSDILNNSDGYPLAKELVQMSSRSSGKL